MLDFFRTLPEEEDDGFARRGQESVAERLARSRNLFVGGSYGDGNDRRRGGWIRL